MRSFFKKYLRDVVYLSVILGLAGWILFAPAKQLDKQWLSHLESTLDQAHQVSEFYSFLTLDCIEDKADSYVNYMNQKFLANAREIDRLTKDFHSKIAQIKDVVSTSSPSDSNTVYKRKIEHKELSGLLAQFRRFTDSLSGLTEQNPELRAELQKIYTKNDSILDCLETNAAINSGLFFKDFTLNVDLASLHALRYCLHKVDGRNKSGFWHFPVASATQAVVRPGEQYKAEIFVASLLAEGIGDLEIAVNGKQMPIIEGVVQYRAIYSSPGIKTYRVDASITDPYTKKKNTYTKTFEVLVVEPCPETR